MVRDVSGEYDDDLGYDLPEGTELIRTFGNKEFQVRVYRDSTGDTYSSDGHQFGNWNDESIDIEDDIDEYEENCLNRNWDSSDYADFFGCDESEVGDAYDDWEPD